MTITAKISQERRSSATVFRPVKIAISLGIAVFCFLQQSGSIVADTKLDIAISPLAFMKRSLHMWDPTQNFGQIPNQAYGYLFPMGPFFAIGHALQLPTWVIQRSWVACLFILAFWGIDRITRLLGIGTSSSRILAALAYVVSPALITFGQTSYYLLPFALLPWIVIPLIVGSRSGSTRKAAAVSAIAVLFIGGANGAAVVAILPVPLLWLLTRSPGPRRRQLLGWWFALVAAVCVWWAIPLSLQGKYGFNQLPFTEQPLNTTSVTSLFEILRGNAIWISYNHIGITAVQSGWDAIVSKPMILATGFLAAVGIFGLAHRAMKEKTWIILSFAVGLIAIGSGYASSAGAPFAREVRSLLSGPLAPFRNVWKFQPIVLFALAIGIAHAIAVASRWSQKVPQGKTKRDARVGNWMGSIVFLLAVCFAAQPLFQQSFFQKGSFSAVPSYWNQTASWLDDHAGPSTSLLIPGSSVASYTWGTPSDEPMQWLAHSNWAVRSLVPNSSVGEIRTLDAINATLRSGIGSSGLASYLSQNGIKYLVQRNDLNMKLGGIPPVGNVYATLTQSPGIERVTGFGPLHSVAALGSIVQLHAVEIYKVGEPVPTATVASIRNSVVVAGGPTALLQMDSSQLNPGSRPILLSGDSTASPKTSSLVVSDTAQRIGTLFGSTEPTLSYILGNTPINPITGLAPVVWNPFSSIASETYSSYVGLANVTASSYGSNPFNLSPSQLPNSAVDGDSETAWFANAANNSIGQWIQLNFKQSISLSSVTILPVESPNSPVIQQVTITTQQGSVVHTLNGVPNPQTVTTPTGASSWLRITLTKVFPAAVPNAWPSGAGISEISVPGIAPDPILVTPTAGIERYAAHDTRNPLYLFASSIPDRSYGPSEAGSDSEAHLRRSITVPKAATFTLRGTVIARPGQAFESLLGTIGGMAFSSIPLPSTCVDGPTVSIDGKTFHLSISGTYLDLSSWKQLSFTTCPASETVQLTAGQHIITANDPSYLKIFTATLVPATAAPLGAPSTTRSVAIHSWGPDSRTLQVSSGPISYLTVRQNFNAGWQAKLGGATLAPIRINGWQQGWVVPAGMGGTITLSYAPNGLYQAGLVLGAILVLCVLSLAIFSKKKQALLQPLDVRPVEPVLLFLLFAAAALALLVGPLAVVILPVVAFAWTGRGRVLLPWFASASMVAASVVVALQGVTNPAQHSGQFGLVTQALCSVAVACVFVALATAKWAQPSRRVERSRGRSDSAE